MIQVKTIQRWTGGFWRGHAMNLEEYEKAVNEFCKTVKVVKITTMKDRNNRIIHTVVYEV